MKHFVSKIVMVLHLTVILLLPHIALAAPLTGADSDVSTYIFHNFMSGYTNDTTDANDANDAGDVLWWVEGNPAMLTKYIGHTTSQFNEVFFNVSTVSPSPSGFVAKYYDGSSWVALTLVGTPEPFGSTGITSFSFTVPGDWATTSVDGVSAYWVRLEGFAGSDSAGVSQISLLLYGAVSTPEFTDFFYITTILAGGWYIYTKTSKKVAESALLN